MTSWKARFEAANQELTQLRSKIFELEAGIVVLQNGFDQATPLSSSGSSPVSSTSSSSNSSIDEIKTSPLGSTTKKRQVAARCRMIVTDLNGVCDKYHESIASVLGNSFIYGDQDEKDDVSKTVSEILNLVIWIPMG